METKPKKGGIAGWPAEERPRERLKASGPAALSEAQLIAVLLRTGSKQKSAIDLAMELLHRFEGLGRLGQAGFGEICTVRGIGLAKACQLLAAFELGRRWMSIPIGGVAAVLQSGDVYRWFYPRLKGKKRETFWTILLDGKNRILRAEAISEGTLTSSLVHPRETFGPAVRESAASVIFVHNHPSGDPSPSREDRLLTRRLVSAGELLGIKVLDHIIVGDGRYTSFADRGWI